MSAPADKKDGPWNQETKKKFNKLVFTHLSRPSSPHRLVDRIFFYSQQEQE